MRNLLVCLFISLSSILQACSCWGPQEFCTVVSDSSYTQDYVVMGRKINDIAHGMELEVIKSYRNEFQNDTISIWGDLGWLCREYTGGFAIGDTFVFNLYQIGDYMLHAFEEPEDFTLSFCGRHYLHVKDGNVVGYINDTQAVQSVDLETFEAFLINDECSDLVTKVGKLEVTIFPNPFVNEINIQSNHRNVTIQIYDITGRLVYKNMTSWFYYNIDLSSFYLPSGMYLLKIIGGGREEKTIKIVKA